jgi:hypothetical protein
MDNRGQVWRGGVFLLLSTAGMLAMPWIAELAPNWMGKSLSDKHSVVMVLSGLACALGVWQLQEGFGWPRRTWRGRALALVVLPCFILPAWLGLFVFDRPADPEVALRPRELPGFRIALPDWTVKSDNTSAFWNGNLTLASHGVAVVLRWNPGDATQTAGFFEGFMSKLGEAKVGAESATIAGRPAQTVYLQQDGQIVGYTAFACGDGRLLVLGSGAENQADARRFHHRLLASVSCVATGSVPPAIVYPTVKLPDGFRESQRDPAQLLFQRGTEEVMVSAEQREMSMFERLATAEKRDEFLGALVQALGARVEGAPKLTERSAPPGDGEGKRQFWSYRLSDSSQMTWTVWRCKETRWFFAMATGEPSSAVERLLGATCP